MYLNGFGIHRERTFDLDVDAQATVFYGRNEAGKSTLMGFVRSMLFGFPKRNNRFERYEPLHGGVHGGVLTILDSMGQEIRIERYEKNDSLKLIYPDGAGVGEAALQSLLGGLTAELYRNLFAFSLSELQRIETLHAEEISGFLLSAGMGISGSTMVQADRKLSQEMDALYKRQGTKQAINEQLKIIEQSELELRRSKERSGRYQEWQVQLANLDESITVDESELAQRRAKLDWLNKCLQSRDSWIKWLEVDQELQDLPVFVDFPEHVLDRYEKLQEDLERAHKELLEIQQESASVIIQRDRITLNEKLIAQRVELQQLLEQAVICTDYIVRIADSSAELEGYRVQLQRYLRQISPDWTEEQLQQFPLSIHHHEQVNAYAERFDSSDNRRRARMNVRERLEEQGEQIRLLNRTLQHNRNEITQLMESEFHQLLAMGREQLHSYELEVRKLWDITTKQASDLIHINERLIDAKRGEQLLQTRRGTDRQVLPTTPVNIVFRILAIAINIIVPMWIILGLDSLTSGVSIFIVLGILNVYLWLGKADKPILRSESDELLLQETRGHRERLEKDAEQLRLQWVERCEQLYRRLSVYPGPGNNNVQTEAATGQSGFVGRGHADVRDTLQQLEPWVEALQLHIIECKQADLELCEVENQLRIVARDLGEVEKQLTAEVDKHREEQLEDLSLKQQWGQWLEQYQLPNDLSVESMKTMFQYAESGLQILDQIRRMNSKFSTYEKTLLAFEQSATTFLRHQGIDIPLNTANIGYELKKLKELLDGQVSIQEQLRHMGQQLSDLDSRELICSSRIEHTMDKLSELLVAGNASDEDELRRWVRLNDRRIELEQSKRHLQVVIFTWVKEEHQHKLFQTLEQSDAAQLEQQLAIVNEAARLLETRLNESKDRRGGLRKEMDNLQSGGQHAELLQRHQEHIAELQRLASKWAELAISAELMRRTKEIFERERQPGVLLRASQYMRTITDGQFVRVISRLGEKSIFVERASGEQLVSSLLSRGTAEQLYLAMRFALADEYSKTAALPLIMDDIFVNFDADRLSRTLTVLSAVAQSHQIILFTCHEHVVHALQAALPRLQTINLEGARR